MLNFQHTLHAQLDAARAFAHHAFDNAEKLATLQMQATRARIERTADTLHKLYVEGKGAELAKTSFAPELERLAAFSHSLIDLSAGAQLALLRLTNQTLAELAAARQAAPAPQPEAKTAPKVAALESATVAPAAPVAEAMPVNEAAAAAPLQVKTSKARPAAKSKAQAAKSEAAFPVPSTRAAKAKSASTKTSK